MTQKTRDKVKGVYASKPAGPTVGVGHGRHQLDGRWGRAKTIFDSELYAVLVAIINDALAHDQPSVEVIYGFPVSDLGPLDFDLIAEATGMTARQIKALELHAEGRNDTEIGVAMDVGRKTAHQHVHAALSKLRQRATSVASSGSHKRGFTP